MNRRVTTLAVRFVIFTCLGAAGFGTVTAQALPKEFLLTRETKDGIVTLILEPDSDVIADAVVNGRSTQTLGMVAAPQANVFVLMYLHTKPVQALKDIKDKSCTIEAGAEKLEYRSYNEHDSKLIEKMWMENILLTVDRVTFEKLTTAASVSFRCGPVRYELSQENREALRHLGDEAKKLKPLLSDPKL